jgi:hypothetical protein
MRSGDKGYLHWGKVLTVEGSGCTIKWQTHKKPSSHSIADVFLTEAAAWVACDSIASSGSASEAPLYPESDHEATDPQTSLRLAAQKATQPGILRRCEFLYINGKPFKVPLGYTGCLPSDQHSSGPVFILAGALAFMVCHLTLPKCVCCIQGNLFLYALRTTLRFSQCQVVAALL